MKVKVDAMSRVTAQNSSPRCSLLPPIKQIRVSLLPLLNRQQQSSRGRVLCAAAAAAAIAYAQRLFAG